MAKKAEDFIRCFGSTTVGPRGQVVIPVGARKELGIEPGSTLLVFRGFHGQGLFLLKSDTIEAMLSTMTEKLTTLEKQIKGHLPERKLQRKKT